MFYWYGGVWISAEKKIAMCVTDVETFQTFLDANLVIVEKLFSMLLFKACKQKQKREGNKKKTQLGGLMVSGLESCLALSSDS